ncbi:MAG: 2-oxoacid:acceptor oxidoreductase family protein [Phycisphaerae bacterium]|nr:2-oxoacid:acceptor oxidoreductase family protein [Phycisphaerae bacterium]
MTETTYTEEVTIAGFGGQGIILLGKLLAQVAMTSGYEVTHMPSYGAEVRGGTANCMVTISEDYIACPLVSAPNSLIVMNQASYDKFLPRLKAGGLMIINSSLIEKVPERKDIDVLRVPADKIATELGSPQSANMVALGAYLQKRGKLSPQKAVENLKYVLAVRHHKTISANSQAILNGAKFVKE